MQSYAILLRPLPPHRKQIPQVRLEPDALRELGRSMGVEILDVLACRGICDAVLLCRAPDQRAVSRVLEALEGWQSEVLLATSHARYDREVARKERAANVQ